MKFHVAICEGLFLTSFTHCKSQQGENCAEVSNAKEYGTIANAPSSRSFHSVFPCKWSRSGRRGQKHDLNFHLLAIFGFRTQLSTRYYVGLQKLVSIQRRVGTRQIPFGGRIVQYLAVLVTNQRISAAGQPFQRFGRFTSKFYRYTAGP